MATEYERKRLENIRRNDEMMAALNVRAKASLLSAATKRPRDESTKSFKKKEKTPVVVMRKSLRTRGLDPQDSSAPLLAPIPFDKKFAETMLGKGLVKDENDDDYPMSSGNACLKKPEKIVFDGEASLILEPHNVARVVPGRVFVVKFMPKLIAAGDKLGNIGFWNLDCGDQYDNDGTYLFHPHSAPVSSLVFQQNSFSKRPNDEQSFYFGDGYGMFKVWDLRAGKSVVHWDLQDHRINSVDFSPKNPHVMATSSTDGTACLWDLRSMGATKPKTLKTVHHSKPVHSAYFSPSALSLATTSVDNYIGLLSGANFEDISMISHDNTTNMTSRGVWGWDDSYIFVGNRPSKGIDVISTELKRRVKELHDPLMNAIPCRLHCHPLNVGVLAGSTAGGGQVYVWTPR